MVGMPVNTLEIILWNSEQSKPDMSMWDASCTNCNKVTTVSFKAIKEGTAQCPDCGILAEEAKS